jgi:hypothetical protein
MPASMKLRPPFCLHLASSLLSGCTFVTVAGAVAGATISVAGTAEAATPK